MLKNRNFKEIKRLLLRQSSIIEQQFDELKELKLLIESQNEEMEALRNEIADLKESNKRLKEQCTDLQKQMDDLNKRMDKK